MGTADEGRRRTRTGARSREGRRPDAGFSLVEVMIAVAAAVIVGAGIYAIFTSQRRAAEAQRLLGDLQTSCSFAMDQVRRELLLAGYRATNPASPISAAAPDSISFEYWDERAPAGAPFDDVLYDRHTQVNFRRDPGGDLFRTVKRWHTGSNGYQPAAAFPALGPPYRQTLARHVEGLAFQFFQHDNEPWVAGTHPLSAIRSVVVSLQCRSAKANPVFTDASRGVVSERFPQVRLQAEVRLRNVDIATNPRDTLPPAAPRNLRAWDTGLCDALQLAWDANTESDLAGYIVYYGLSSGLYANRVRIARGPGASGTRVSFALTGLQPTRACDPTPATYFVRVEAFDKSGNPSPRSAEVSGNPSPSIAVESETGNDTTVNPAAPPAPAGFVAGTPVDNQAQLSWTPSAVAGLVGYRLHRSVSGPGFTPVGTVAGTGTCIADERTLGPGATGFLDTGVFLDPAILQGCTAYHYQLAAIHCDGCLPAAVTNFAPATATPTDGSPPPAPRLDAHDGWRRIVLRLDNPLRTVTPDFDHTRVWFGKAGYPVFDPGTRTVTGGTPVPDRGGVFTADGTVTINFDSESVEEPGPPQLDVDATYYFLAVSFDRCGNPSDVQSESRTKGEQCADCLPAEPCHGGPSAPSGIRAAAGCADSITLAWADPDTILHPDFNGFHVYRCPKQYHTLCGPADWTELTSGYIWEPTFTDTRGLGLTEGSFFSYRIRATDCYYEDHLATWPATGDPDNDPADNFNESFIDGLYIGAIEREELFPGPTARVGEPVLAGDDRIAVVSDRHLAANFPADAVSGTRTILVGEEIISCRGSEGPPVITPGVITASAFTSCTRGVQGTSSGAHGVGDLVLPFPSTTPIQALSGSLAEAPPSFQHNVVELRVRNSAAGALTITELGASWQNQEAFLQQVVLGDDQVTPTTVVWSDASGTLTHGATSGPVVLSNAQVAPLDQRVPVALTFMNADRSVTSADNMREERLDLDLPYRNESTGDEGCGGRTTVFVPLGPYLYGTTQDMPNVGTYAVPVPGDSGENRMNAVLVPGQQMVNVFTNVSDSDYAGIREVRLYYYVDSSRALAAAPALDPAARYAEDPAADNLAPYQRIDLQAVAGNQWRTPPGAGIPASNDANVWFFVVAVDNNGNFDREPEPGSGAFQYYQQPFDVCRNVPEPPALTGSVSGGAVRLAWTAPLRNTDGTSCTDLGGYRVYRGTTGSGPVRLAELPDTALSYIDTPPDLGAEVYSYYVTAIDTCTEPGANESRASGSFTECEGSSGCMLQLATTQADPAFFQAGDSFAIDLFVCEKADGISDHKLYVQVCSGVDGGPVTLAEDGDAGTFRIDPAAAQQSGSVVRTWLTEPGDADRLDLRVAATDTVAVHAWSDASPSGGCGSLTRCSASIRVQEDPCRGIAAPTVSGLTVSVSGAPGTCSSTRPTVDLGWSGEPPSAALFYRVYRCSNANNRPDCDPVVDGSKIYPLGTEPDTGQTALGTTDSPGKKADTNHIRYQVEAVSHNGCPDAGLWRTAISSAVVDNCP